MSSDEQLQRLESLLAEINASDDGEMEAESIEVVVSPKDTVSGESSAYKKVSNDDSATKHDDICIVDASKPSDEPLIDLKDARRKSSIVEISTVVDEATNTIGKDSEVDNLKMKMADWMLSDSVVEDASKEAPDRDESVGVEPTELPVATKPEIKPLDLADPHGAEAEKRMVPSKEIERADLADDELDTVTVKKDAAVSKSKKNKKKNAKNNSTRGDISSVSEEKFSKAKEVTQSDVKNQTDGAAKKAEADQKTAAKAEVEQIDAEKMRAAKEKDQAEAKAKKTEKEAKLRAEEEAKKKTEEDAKKMSEEEAEAKLKAEEEAKKKNAEEEADAKKTAEKNQNKSETDSMTIAEKEAVTEAKKFGNATSDADKADKLQTVKTDEKSSKLEAEEQDSENVETTIAEFEKGIVESEPDKSEVEISKTAEVELSVEKMAVESAMQPSRGKEELTSPEPSKENPKDLSKTEEPVKELVKEPVKNKTEPIVEAEQSKESKPDPKESKESKVSQESDSKVSITVESNVSDVLAESKSVVKSVPKLSKEPEEASKSEPNHLDSDAKESAKTEPKTEPILKTDSKKSEPVDDSQTVYLYMSMASGVRGAMSRFNRAATILSSYDIKCVPVEITMDERARRLWKYKGVAKNKVLPAVFRDGDLKCDYNELVEANEIEDVEDLIFDGL